MKTEETKNERHFSISSRKEFAEALRSPDPSIRASLLQAINKQVDHAIETGKNINQEIIDELFKIYMEQQESFDRSWYAFFLLRLNSAYTLEVARKEFISGEKKDILLLAASQLSKMRAEERAELLGPLVMDASNPTRCRAAANLLDDCIDYLDPEIALRAAVISDHDLTFPSVSLGTIGAWINELCGPYPQTTRKKLIGLGAEAIKDFMYLWEYLPDDIRVWVLHQAVERQIPEIEDKIRETMRQDTGKKLLLCAIECFKALKLEDEGLLFPLYKHDDSSVRAAAISAGFVALDWSPVMDSENSLDVRLAMISRMGRCGGRIEIELLTKLLKDTNWRIRARAVDSLVALGPESIESLRESLASEIESVRVAAAQGLLRLEEEDLVLASLKPEN